MWVVKMHKPGYRASLQTVFFKKNCYWGLNALHPSGRDLADEVPSRPKSMYSISNTLISLRGLSNLTKSVGKGSFRAVELNTRFSATHTILRVQNHESNVADRSILHESN